MMNVCFTINVSVLYSNCVRFINISDKFINISGNFINICGQFINYSSIISIYTR